MNYIYNSLKLFNSIKRNLFSDYSLVYNNFSDNAFKNSFQKKQKKEKIDYYKSNYKDYSIKYNFSKSLFNEDNITYSKNKNSLINKINYAKNHFFKSHLINYNKSKSDNKDLIKYKNYNNFSLGSFKKINQVFFDKTNTVLYSQNNKTKKNDLSSYIFDKSKTFDDYKKEYSINKNQGLSIDSLTDYLLDEINVSGYSLSK